MATIVNFCKTNPVRAMAIVNALIVFAVAFGLHLTTQQIVAIGGLATVVLGLGGELVRSQVTPTATLPDHVAAVINAAADADVPKKTLVVPAATIVPAPVGPDLRTFTSGSGGNSISVDIKEHK